MTDPQGNDKAEAASSGTANLYRRAVTGGFWAFALRVCQQILAAGRLLLLAYLFVPGDFGLVAIAAVTIATLTTFTQTGFGAALIQKKGDIAADLNSVWTAGLVRAGLLFLVLFLGAPYAAHFFDAKPAITADHIMSPQSLARRLVESEEPAVAYLRERLDEATREDVSRQLEEAVPGAGLAKSVAKGLNGVLGGAVLAGEAAFEEVLLSARTRERQVGYLKDGERDRANGVVLEALFEGQLATVVIDRETATLVIRVMGLTVLLGALGNVGMVYFTRDLRLSKRFVLQMATTLTDVLVVVGVALVTRSVWALVFGRLASSVVQVVLSYVLQPFRPRLQWDWERLKSLWGFGRWVLLTQILVFLMTQGDDAFVGRLLGPAMLGLYFMAYKVAYLPASEITGVFSQVTFPAFSRLQDEQVRLREAFFKSVKLTGYIAFPLAGLIFSLVGPFVRLFMAERWEPIILPAQILALSGVLRALASTVSPLAMALGRVRATTVILLVRVVVFGMLIYPLTRRWGIVGTVLADTLSTIIIQPVAHLFAARLLKASGWSLARQTILPLAGTCVMVGGLLAVQSWVWREVGHGQFFVLAASAVCLYVSVTVALDGVLGFGMRAILREQWQVLRRADRAAQG